MKADDRAALKTRIWYTADSRYVQVRQMETSYIRACMRLILMKRFWRRRYFVPLRNELIRRDEL